MENEKIIDSNISDSDLKVIDGTLHFKDHQAYFKIEEEISNMSEEELDIWEKSLNFNSYRSVFSKSADEFHKLDQPENFEIWKKKYHDILYMEDDVVIPIIDSYRHQLIANRKGIFYIGGELTKIYKNKIISIKDGDISKLDTQLLEGDLPNSENITFRELPKSQIYQVRNNNTCNSEFNHATASTQNGKRKAFIALTSSLERVDAVTSLYHTLVVLRVYGHKKSLFGWNLYKTLLAYDKLSFQVRDHEGILHTQSDTSHTNSSTSQNLYLRLGFGNFVYLNSNPSAPYFEWLQGRGITRGVGDNHWAVICCNTGCPSSSGADPFP